MLDRTVCCNDLALSCSSLKRQNFTPTPTGGPTAPAGAMRDKGLQPVVGDQNATIFEWIDPVSETSIPVLYVVFERENLNHPTFLCSNTGTMTDTVDSNQAIRVWCPKTV